MSFIYVYNVNGVSIYVNVGLLCLFTYKMLMAFPCKYWFKLHAYI